MANPTEIAVCLRVAAAMLAQPAADLGWSKSHDSVEHLRRELLCHLARVEAGDLSADHLFELKMLFAPTGALQEASLASGWDDQFLTLSERFDAALCNP